MKQFHSMFTFVFVRFFAALLMLNACQTKNSGTVGADGSSIDSTTVQDSAAYFAKKRKRPKVVHDSTEKVIYLTMDDGPLRGSTILNKIILDKKIKTSVFIVSGHIRGFGKYFDDFRANEFMEICNHSHTHANNKYLQFYSNPQGAADDINQCDKLINTDNKAVRLPGRNIWALPARDRGIKQSGGKTAEILRSQGFKLYGWDAEWAHGNKSQAPVKSPEQFVALINSIFKNKTMLTKNHLVILGHDEMLTTEKGRREFPQIIDMLLAKGYVFEHITNYPD
jgi:peptidoglycan/xylan/chitin deacetylase (PgdA/CDA1 family)